MFRLLSLEGTVFRAVECDARADHHRSEESNPHSAVRGDPYETDSTLGQCAIPIHSARLETLIVGGLSGSADSGDDLAARRRDVVIGEDFRVVRSCLPRGDTAADWRR